MRKQRIVKTIKNYGYRWQVTQADYMLDVQFSEKRDGTYPPDLLVTCHLFSPEQIEELINILNEAKGCFRN